jgi:hypothetical protein
MPLDDLGLTHATLMQATSFRGRDASVTYNLYRDGDRLLESLVINEEYLVNASHQLELTTSMAFVYTARRSYQSSYKVNPSDRCLRWKVE